MKPHAAIALRTSLVAGAFLAGCAYVKHVPPGQSLSAALARKPQLVAMPSPSPAPVAALSATATPPGLASASPSAPPRDTETVADSFTLGNLCMQQGRYPEAIAAFQSAVKADPSFAEAWNNLAIAYQDAGQEEKAMAAFRKYKMVALH